MALRPPPAVRPGGRSGAFGPLRSRSAPRRSTRLFPDPLGLAPLGHLRLFPDPLGLAPLGKTRLFPDPLGLASLGKTRLFPDPLGLAPLGKTRLFPDPLGPAPLGKTRLFPDPLALASLDKTRLFPDPLALASLGKPRLFPDPLGPPRRSANLGSFRKDSAGSGALSPPPSRPGTSRDPRARQSSALSGARGRGGFGQLRAHSEKGFPPRSRIFGIARESSELLGSGAAAASDTLGSARREFGSTRVLQPARSTDSPAGKREQRNLDAFRERPSASPPPRNGNKAGTSLMECRYSTTFEDTWGHVQTAGQH
ncbi:uncharacterized protein [Pithys albifrons albifrons]|uniref:uncharacterized protein n=1 Tax=Pithys albifrons albifrons TaxID=3385563 RepID=UPI003A5CCC47